MSDFTYDIIIFDVDGTLYQTEKVAVPAFLSVFDTLQEKGLYQGETPSEDKILSCFGMTIPELWETLLPDASMDIRDQANELLAHGEIALMEAGKGELYPGVKETLQQLHDAGLRLYTASNGEERYVETVIHTTGLAHLFTDLYSAGKYKTEKKEELVQKLLQDTGTTNTKAVMVGDRKSDITAGRANDLFTVGCDFGFAGKNELDGASAVITKFSDLIEILREDQR